MTQTTLEYRAARVSVALVLSAVLSIALQLISVPLCLKFWGKEMYGAWLALFAAFTMLRSVEIGFSTFVGNKVNLLYHAADQRLLRETLASSLVGIVVLGGLQLLIAGLITGTGQLPSLLGISDADADQFRAGTALLVLILTWLLSGSFISVVHKLQIPAGLMFQSIWWGTAFQVTQFACLIIAAGLQLDLLQTSALFAFGQAANYLASAAYIQRKLPDHYPWWKGGNLRVGLKDLAASTSPMLSALGQQGTASGLVVLVSAIAGLAAVPVFTTLRTLANLWTNVSTLLTGPLLPDVARFHAKGEGTKLIAVSHAHWWLLGTVVNIGVLITYPALPALYALWTGGVLQLDRALLAILLGSIAVANAGALIHLYLSAINDLKAIFATSVIRSCATLLLAGALLPQIGLAGVGVGILAGECLALLVAIHFFFVAQQRHFSETISIAALAPSALATVSVLVYLVPQGLGLAPSHALFWSAVAGAVCASWWGWLKLEPAIRDRLILMFSWRLAKG